MNNTRVWIVLGFILGISIATEFFGVTPHTDHFWDTIPGFDALFGLVGALILIILAKVFLGPILQKPEDHYAQGGEDQ